MPAPRIDPKADPLAFLPEHERGTLRTVLADYVRAHGGDPRLPEVDAGHATEVIAAWVRAYGHRQLEAGMRNAALLASKGGKR